MKIKKLQKSEDTLRMCGKLLWSFWYFLCCICWPSTESASLSYLPVTWPSRLLLLSIDWTPCCRWENSFITSKTRSWCFKSKEFRFYLVIGYKSCCRNPRSQRLQVEVSAEIYGELSTNLFTLEKVCCPPLLKSRSYIMFFICVSVFWCLIVSKIFQTTEQNLMKMSESNH